MRLLLVEDSVRLRVLLGENLRGAGYSLDSVGTAAEARAAAAVVAYDLIIVDLGLPDDDGIALIRGLRSSRAKMPIMIITARARVDDRVAGLDSGADDYLVKPFNHSELPTMQIGRLVFNETRCEVYADGRTLDLRASERRLLALLMRRAGSVVPKSTIEEDHSEFGRELSANAVEANVSRLRKALDDTPAGVFIETIRGVGYALRETSG